MARQWVVNNTSGTRTINGVLLAPGEGTWVDDSPAPSGPTPTPQLRAALSSTQVAALAAAGYPVASGTLLVDPATGQVYGQSDGVGGYTPLGGGLTAGGITGLPAVDSTLPLIVPGVQGANLTQATLRPAQWCASYAALLALTGMQSGDRATTATGVLGNMRPVDWVYDGTRWIPTGIVEWNLGNLIATKTAAGLFGLTAGGSTALCLMPANLLRAGSHAEGEIVFGRNTASGTDSIAVRLMLGTTPSLVVGTDNMASTSPEGRFRFMFDFRGGQDGYSTFFSGFGNNQPLCASVSNAQINLAADMAFGLDLGSTPTGSTFSVEMFNVKLSV